ncbi:MAG: alanyl-tRNA editing protein [Candidatus Aenigmarchaeota archaeon]|nr:alanyl-tRNA editing protein [Candidatus Aenigmarchaeota archaeon]
MTELLYLHDSYTKESDATVVKAEGKRIVLDKTCFYPGGGGQPRDKGPIEKEGEKFEIINAKKEGNDVVLEVDKEGLSSGDNVHVTIDWDYRYKLMRMHTAAHIIDAVLYKEANALCTGNQLGAEKSRIDFSLEVLDMDKMKKYFEEANELAKRGIEVKIYFMKREEALKIPGIVKLAAVMPPAVEELRIVEIPGIDIQADGGTQVKNTKEIGTIELLSVENKGKSNRRVYFTVQ